MRSMMMRAAVRLAPALIALAVGGGALAQTDDAPAWAYPVNPPQTGPRPPRPDPAEAIHVPGSAANFTRGNFKGLSWVPDWFPAEHGLMPSIVSEGRPPEIGACGYCHLATGDGRPENAGVSGLPKDYIISQVHQFRDGTRVGGGTSRGPQELMIRLAKAATEEEIAAAAAYFAATPHRTHVKVVESDTAPKTKASGNVYFRDPAGGTELLGRRIIETPQDAAIFELRDPHTAYTAYVPKGSLARGKGLIKTWGPKGSLACTSCHGKDLKGVGEIPPLAGRSPTYIVRQLNDFRTGARSGPQAAPMALVTAGMKNDDMIALAAYAASLKP